MQLVAERPHRLPEGEHFSGYEEQVMTTNNRQSRLMLMILVAMAAFDIGSESGPGAVPRRERWGLWWLQLRLPANRLLESASDAQCLTRTHGPVSNNVYANSPKLPISTIFEITDSNPTMLPILPDRL